MNKILYMMAFLLFIHHVSHAQLGTSNIGTSTIGVNNLAYTTIGKAATQKCALPGPCGSACIVYTFTGAGNWDIEGNWAGNNIPPAVLFGCMEIIIDPEGTNECLMNIPVQIIPPGASLIVKAGKKFRVPGELVQQ